MMKQLSRHFFRGVLVIVPILATGAFLFWLFVTAEQLFRGPLELFLPEGWYVPGMGLVSAIVFTLLVGLLVNVYFIHVLFEHLEKLLNKLPLVKQVYNSIQDLMSFLGDSGKDELKKVVALEVSGMKLIGFVTGENTAPGQTGDGEEKMLSVYLPMSYQVGGYLVYVPESRCEILDMPVRQAMQTVFTANIARDKR